MPMGLYLERASEGCCLMFIFYSFGTCSKSADSVTVHGKCLVIDNNNLLLFH